MKSSGKQGASALIYTGPCRLLGVQFSADEAKFPTLTVEDNTTSAGTNIKAFGRAAGGVAATGGACNFVVKWSRDDNNFCENGLYATLSATEGDYIIDYEPM